MYYEDYNLCVSMLGGFRVWIDGKEVPASSWRLRKVKSLFKLLSLTPEHHLHREQLMDVLWPDQDPHSAANNLNQVLYHARRTLCMQGCEQEFLKLMDEQVYLDTKSGVWVDVDAFQETAARAHKSHHPDLLKEAIDLYTGDLLPEDPYEEWAIIRREELRQEYHRLLLEFARQGESDGNTSQAIDALSRLVAEDPLREEAHADLMRLFALAGSRSAALHQYQVLKEILLRELGVGPVDATQQIYKAILDGKLGKSGTPARPHGQTVIKHNLPSRLTSFIGRSKEIKQVHQLFSSNRLVTLSGSGGVGKTRLAIQLGFRMLNDQPDGVWLADLAPVMDLEFVAQTVVDLFKPNKDGQQSAIDILKEHLRDKRCLLILDNCEHLVQTCAELVEILLHSCPGLIILVTSREGLGCEGERVYIVPPMTYPALSPLPPLDQFNKIEAVALFIDRVQQQLPEFSVTENNLQAVAIICQRLDGIPLALELAAGRAGLLSIEQIAERLDDCFRLLTGGSRTGLSRQRTLQASIDWSYDLLTDQEQCLLRRLSVFSGRWLLEAAEEVSADGHGLIRDDVLDLIASLVRKSLVIVDRQVGVEPVYHMLETVRNYAQDKLKDAGELAMTRDRHLAYCLRFVGEVAPKLKSDRLLEGMKQLRANLDNLRSALSWSLRSGEDDRLEMGLRLVNNLAWFWERAMLEKEGRFWLERGLSSVPSQDDRWNTLKAYTLSHLAGLHFDLFELQQVSQESIEIFRELEDRQGLAQALLSYGGAISTFDRVQANHILDEAIELYRQLDCPWELAYALKTRSRIMENHGEDWEIEMYAQESLDLFLETGDYWQANTGPLGLLANIHARKGEVEKAKAYIHKSLEYARESGDADLGWTLHYLGTMNYYLGEFCEMEDNFRLNLAMIHETSNDFSSQVWILRFIAIALKRQGKFNPALSTYLESLSMSQQFYDPYGIYASIAGIAGVMIGLGDSLKAACLLGLVDTFISTFTKPMDRIDLLEFNRDKEAVKETLSEVEFLESWQKGSSLSLETALQGVFTLGNHNNMAIEAIQESKI